MATAVTQAKLGAQILKSFRPTISDQTHIGCARRDSSSQTEKSDIVDLKETYEALQDLLQESGSLKKDVGIAKKSLELDYRKRVEECARDLYHDGHDRLLVMEKEHLKHMDTLRRSFRTQLSDAVARIAAEYKAYYDEILQGKTGRHDRKIQDLSLQVSSLKQTIQQNNTVIQMLQAQLQKISAEKEESEEEPEAILEEEPVQVGLSSEEADEMQASIENLQLRVRELQNDLADKEAANKSLTKKLHHAKEQYEMEHVKAEKLKAEMESQHRNAAQAGAASALEMQMELEKNRQEMEEKLRKIQEGADAGAKKLIEEARRAAQEELRVQKARQDAMEAKLLKERDALANQDSSRVIRQLKEESERQRQTILRLEKELKRTIDYWTLKLSIVEKNLNVIREEALLRANLQKQAATLHRAAITYAPDGPVLMVPNRSPQKLIPAVQFHSPSRPVDSTHTSGVNQDDAAVSTWRAPTPSSGRTSRSLTQPTPSHTVVSS